MRLRAIALFALSLACIHRGPASTVANPYTVEELRQGCRTRVIDYRFEQPGQPPRIERWSFAEINPETVDVTTLPVDEQGQAAGIPQTQSSTWAELHTHADFPPGTSALEEKLEIPAGTFDTTRYSFERKGEQRTVWFAHGLAGPPVKMLVAKDGKAVLAMTMLSTRAK